MEFIEKYFWVFSIFLVPVTYILVASIFYFLFYRWKKNAWLSHKIHAEESNPRQLRREIRYGLLALSIFCGTGGLVYLLYVHGLSQLYLQPLDHGWFYFFFSILLMILFHDTYFYWTHRLLHLPGMFEKFHRVHHLSHHTSPFTSLSFHPVESLIQGAVLPLMVMLIPAHPYALFVFLLFMVYKNVRGHAGFEFRDPQDRQSGWYRYHNSVTHHDIHHAKGRANYGLYFNVWDRWMRTFRQE